MLKPVKRLQPRSYHAFRCIGAECEDTCCIGWIVNVDKPTYEAYQRCEDPELGPRLHELVTINATGTTEDSYARIALSGPGCPFLADGLCSIQKKLGEEYLSRMCARYPRVMNIVDDVLERSLDLSCPEAARMVLLKPDPMEFDEEAGPQNDSRFGRLPVLQTLAESSGKPYRCFRDIRSVVIWLLQYREYPLWKRLVLLGSLCDELQAMAAEGRQAQAPEILEAYREAARRNLFDEALSQLRPQPVEQLELILELIVARIGSDFTPPRFLECYRQFMQGIEWTAESSMEGIAGKYVAAFSQYYAPFLSGHEHMLEHYLVNYAHRTLFPLGPQESNRELSEHHASDSIRDQCQRMMIHYGMIQTLLIGMAGFHKEQFGAGQAIQAIQSFTKAFEHSLTFPKRTLEILEEKRINNCAGLAALLWNRSTSENC